MIIWIFGQPGSGKTTLAELFMKDHPHPQWHHVDGDEIRKLYGNGKYGIEGRIRNHLKAIEICNILQHNGINVIVSMVTPYRLLRKMINEELKDVFFVFLNYDKSMPRGKEQYYLPDFETPARDEFIEDKKILYLNTTTNTVEKCYDLILQQIGEIKNKE